MDDTTEVKSENDPKLDVRDESIVGHIDLDPSIVTDNIAEIDRRAKEDNKEVLAEAFLAQDKMNAVTKDQVDIVDAKFNDPYKDYKMIMTIFKQVLAVNGIDFEPRQVANFAGHFLLGMFEVDSMEFRKMRSILGDIYYYHYMSLMDKEASRIITLDH